MTPARSHNTRRAANAQVGRYFSRLPEAIDAWMESRPGRGTRTDRDTETAKTLTNNLGVNRIVEGAPESAGTRVELTTRDGVVVNGPGTVVRYHSLNNPIVEVVLDDGSHWLAQPKGPAHPKEVGRAACYQSCRGAGAIAG